MEYKLTNKHLFIATAVGVLASVYMLYQGLQEEKAERWLYAGIFNTHDSMAYNRMIDIVAKDTEWRAKNPHAHMDKSYYATSCVECHTTEERWQPVSNETCMTAACHRSIDPRTLKTQPDKYHLASGAYHARLEAGGHNCSDCHRIHFFNRDELTWYGEAFNHATLIPNWRQNHDCQECHTSFESFAEIDEIMPTIPRLGDPAVAREHAIAHGWLLPGAGGSGGRLALNWIIARSGSIAGQIAANLADAAKRRHAAADSEPVTPPMEAILYFRSSEGAQPGKPGDVYENYLFRTAAFQNALNWRPLIVVHRESAPDWWSTYGVDAASTLVRVDESGNELGRLAPGDPAWPAFLELPAAAE